MEPYEVWFLMSLPPDAELNIFLYAAYDTIILNYIHILPYFQVITPSPQCLSLLH